MDSIDPEALYDERGDVSPARPLLQGDVFSGVVLPGFGDEAGMVQIVTHPCAMRTGADLTPRITVAPVVPHQRVPATRWDGHLRVMPLEALQRESSPVLTEAHLQWDWLEAVLAADEVDGSSIDAEVREFDAWLDGGDPRRRELLRDEVNHADVRRQANRAQRERAEARRRAR